MHDMWNKLFDKVVFYEPDCIKVGRMLDEEVDAILEPLKESMSETELEVIRDMIHSIAFSAQKYGFNLGIRTAMTMLMEATQSQDDPDRS